MKTRFLFATALVAALVAGDFGRGQSCTVSRCEGYTAGGLVNGKNHCYDVEVVLHPHSGTTNCVWDGTTCKGSPCKVDYDVHVSWDIDQTTCSQVCPQNPRARVKIYVCGSLFATSVVTPEYTENGTIDPLPCNCDMQVAVEPANLIEASNPCLGGWSYYKAAICSQCTASFPPN